MFEFVSEKLKNALTGLLGSKQISEKEIIEAIGQVRLALLDADVNFTVVKQFTSSLREKALSSLKDESKIKGLDPRSQVIKWIHDELVILLGGKPTPVGEKSESFKEQIVFNPKILSLDLPFTSILVCGLQGCGKTTQVAKLAQFIKKSLPSKRILISACDRQRPQAMEQLRLLAQQVDVDFIAEGSDAVMGATLGLAKAKSSYDVLITDTAGRLYIDDQLMDELEAVKSAVNAHETLFVANATMGQDVAKSAKTFHDKVALTGAIVTMLDSDAKGGAVLSIHMMTGQSIKFEGIGEKIDDLQLFNPHSMADRILGMGDTINLVRKLKENISEEDSRSMEKKIMSASFTFEDFLKQMQAFKRMGPLASMMKMIPGASNMPLDEKRVTRTEAMILAMTPLERTQKVELSVSRRKRIARGSGTKLEDVHQLVKSFEQMRSLVKNMPNLKQQMKKVMGGGFSWR